MANLNRIRNLESLVAEHKAALEEMEGENESLRTDLLEKSRELVEQERSAAAEADEVTALREELAERENQLLAMSRRLSDMADGRAMDIAQSMRTSGGSTSMRQESMRTSGMDLDDDENREADRVFSGADKIFSRAPGSHALPRPGASFLDRFALTNRNVQI